MEKTNVPYEEWPEWIKTTTAFYSKSLVTAFKNPRKIRYLSFVNLGIGVLVILEGIYFSRNSMGSEVLEKMDFMLIFLGILNLIIGLLAYSYGYRLYSWIANNSSWEERFAYKSSGKHQFRYILTLVVILAISWGIACAFCC